jgi:6-phosphogluconolactonase
LIRLTLIVGLLGDLSPAPTSTAGGMGFVYTLLDINGGPNQLYGFQVQATTGALTPLTGFPIATGGTGDALFFSQQVAYDKANARLYVLNGGSHTISSYTVNTTTGALTALPFSPISLGTSQVWACLAVHPGGSPLVVGGRPDLSLSNGFLASFNITATDVMTATDSPYSTGTAVPFSCAFSSDGAYVYTGGVGGVIDSIAGFSADAGTGILTPLAGSPFATGAFAPDAYATDSAGRLFVSGFSSGQMRAFTTSGGALTPVSGNPFPSGLSQAVHGVLHPAGYYMVADRSGNRVGVYQIAGDDGATTLSTIPGSPFAAGDGTTVVTSTNVLALNQNGNFLFAANANSRSITTFMVDAGTGTLARSAIQPVDTLGTSGRVTGMAYIATPPDLTLNKHHSGNLTLGTNGVYTLQVSNATGAGPASGTITVTDILPAGLDFVAGDGSDWNCTSAGPAVTCTFPGPLPGGTSLPDLMLTVSVTGATRTITNTASVTTPGEIRTSDNSASDPTAVTSAYIFLPLVLRGS